jgi:hypothetical protein
MYDGLRAEEGVLFQTYNCQCDICPDYDTVALTGGSSWRNERPGGGGTLVGCTSIVEGEISVGIWVSWATGWDVLSTGGVKIRADAIGLVVADVFFVTTDLRLRRTRDGRTETSSAPTVSAISASLFSSLPLFPELKPRAIRTYLCSSAGVRWGVLRLLFCGLPRFGLNTQSGCIAMNSALIAAACAMKGSFPSSDSSFHAMPVILLTVALCLSTSCGLFLQK